MVAAGREDREGFFRHRKVPPHLPTSPLFPSPHWILTFLGNVGGGEATLPSLHREGSSSLKPLLCLCSKKPQLATAVASHLCPIL